MSGTTHHSTGVPDLDDVLGGGYPAGTIICLTAPVGAQSEVLLQAFTSEHPALYISTTRSEQAVKDEMDHSSYTPVDPFIIQTEQGAPVSDAEDSVKSLINDTQNVIIDPVNVIERATDPGHYLTFLNKLKTTVTETGGVILLHCYENSNAGVGAAREYTIGVADVLLTFERDVVEESVDEFLDVPKNRYGGAMDERVKVTLTDIVEVDTTRNIM